MPGAEAGNLGYTLAKLEGPYTCMHQDKAWSD